jgi:hypothetical protein
LAAGATARPANGAARLLGLPMRRGALRAGAERELRVCAHLARNRAERIRFVDEANRARPFTLF